MAEILDRTIVLLPGQEKGNVVIPFMLNRAYASLHIYCKYGPKTVQDEALSNHLVERAIAEQVPHDLRAGMNWRDFLPLKNLVTPSLDYEDTYLGCAHRQDEEMLLTVSRTESSPGFLRHAVEPGRWRVVLNLHAVMIPVTYRLTVTAREDGA